MTTISTLEGQLFLDNRHPIFVKALTHSARVVELPPGFLRNPAYLACARRLVVRHHKWYLEQPVARTFQIECYVLCIAGGRSVRFSVDGQVLGVFSDTPVDASFSIAGTSYEIAHRENW